jgi:NaMN:DMB phosphoribosyltransferase
MLARGARLRHFSPRPRRRTRQIFALSADLWRPFFIATVGVSALVAFAGPLAAAECPVSGAEATSEAIEQAPSCEKATEVYLLCTWGSSVDIQFADIAIGKCEADFLSKLTAQQRRTYDRAKQRCGRKYARESGTLYRSFEASCSVKLAKTYWDRVLKPSAGKPKR